SNSDLMLQRVVWWSCVVVWLRSLPPARLAIWQTNSVCARCSLSVLSSVPSHSPCFRSHRGSLWWPYCGPSQSQQHKESKQPSTWLSSEAPVDHRCFLPCRLSDSSDQRQHQ